MKHLKIFEEFDSLRNIELAIYMDKELDGLAHFFISTNIHHNSYKARVIDSKRLKSLLDEHFAEGGTMSGITYLISDPNNDNDLYARFELDLTKDDLSRWSNNILDREQNGKWNTSEDIISEYENLASEMLVILSRL